MKKFKFMSKLAAGMMAVAMTFGSLSGLGVNAPVTVYAAETQTATSIKFIKTQPVVAPGEGGNDGVEFKATVYDQNGESMTTQPTIVWEIKGNAKSTTTFTNGKLKIDADETAKTLTLTAKVASPALSTDFEVTVGTGAYLDIKYEDMTASIDSNGTDSFLFLEVLKDDKGTKPGTIYCYEKSEAEKIDLSFLKLSKPVYIRVYGDKNPTPLKIYTVAAQDKKPSVKYVTGQNTFYKSFQLNKSDLDDTKVKTLQWRTQYGEKWNAFATLEDNISSLTVAGSTILVRAISPDWDKPATPEVKVKIAAAPKAPKATLDYAKNMIKLPKASEIRVPGWIIPSQVKPEGATAFEAVETPFYYTVGSSKDDLTVAPMDLAKKLLEKYIEEYNAAVAKLDGTLKADVNTTTNQGGGKNSSGKYVPYTTSDTGSGDTLKKCDKTVFLEKFEADGYSFLVRTAKSAKKGASQPTFVDVKAAPVIGFVEETNPKASTQGEPAKIKKDVIAVMELDENDTMVATKDTLSFAYSDTELKLTPSSTAYTYAYSLDGGVKFSKLSKETSIKLEKIDATKGVIIRTEGSKEDLKKSPVVEGKWASNEVTLPVPIVAVEVSGKTELTKTTSGTEIYNVVYKNALGQEVKAEDAEKTGVGTITWSASTGAAFDSTTKNKLVNTGNAGKLTITATYKDLVRGVEVKGTLEVEVKEPAT